MLWAAPGLVRIPGAHTPLAALLARRAGFQALYLSGAAEIRTFAAVVKVPLLANMTEFGRTPLIPADEMARLGYKVVIWPVTALRLAARAMEEGEDYEALDTTIAKSVLPASSTASGG